MNFMRNLIKTAVAPALVCGAMLLSSVSAQAAYVIEDVVAAKGDVAQLRKIFEDKETAHDTRVSALTGIEEYTRYQGLEEYVDTPFMQEDADYRAVILPGIAHIKSGKWKDGKHYLPALQAIFETGRTFNLYQVHRMHVISLIQEGKGKEALSESKRLLGLAHVTELWLTEAIQVIGTAVRADAMSQGKSIKEAIAEQNAYLEAIKKGDVSQTSYARAPFPTLQPLATKAEESDKADVRVSALLFNGQYDKAEKIARGQLAIAMTEEELQAAVLLLGRVLNGKAGLPSAANAVMGE